MKEYVLVQVEQPIVEVFQRNKQGQWVLFEYGLSDRIFLKAVNVEIAVSDLVYRQIKFDLTLDIDLRVRSSQKIRKQIPLSP